MNSPSLSKKITQFLHDIEENAMTKSQRVAVQGARLRLAQQAAFSVCLTCEHADWWAYWGPLEGSEEWNLILSKCAAGALLFPEDGAGLTLPTFQFCSAKDGTSGGPGGNGGSQGGNPSMMGRRIASATDATGIQIHRPIQRGLK